MYYFPEEIQYTIKLIKNQYNDSFNFEIKNNILIITRTDLNSGWKHHHSVEICFTSNQKIFLFNETYGDGNNWITSYVTFNNNKILDSRDLEYYYNNRAW